MTERQDENEMLAALTAWGAERADVRAMVLTSSRTNPSAPLDRFSDYDVIVVVEAIEPYRVDESWLGVFGPVLCVYRDPVRQEQGFAAFADITQYESGLKIDFTFYPVGLMQQVVTTARESGRLEPDLDLGYRVLLDKDDLTGGLPQPTHRAYIPSPPPEAEYQRVIETFFAEGAYVVKNLWRGELLPMKYSLDEVMKQHYLRPMLEWRMEIDHNWAVKTGTLGKGLHKRLPPTLWAELEASYVGAGEAENWGALYRTIDVFRQAAKVVGEHLGYSYPEDLDRRCMAYFERVQGMAH